MASLLSRALRPLRGANLEVFKFGMYLLFPIGWMYYFGTNLENRFSVPDFWPTQEQSHKIPFEKEEIRAEVERIRRNMQVDQEQARQRQQQQQQQQQQQEQQRRDETDRALHRARDAFNNRGGRDNVGSST